jgi:hypothetical protein
MIRRAILAVTPLLLALLATSAIAQEDAAPVEVPPIPGEAVAALAECAALESPAADALATTANLLVHGLTCVTSLKKSGDDVRTALRATLESPETRSRLLNSLLERDHGWQFLRDVNFKVKTFQSDNSGEAALGFSYDYRKSIQDHDLSCGRVACVRGLDLEIAANGNVAADADRNPHDLLETNLSFALFQSTGGVSEATPEHRRKFGALRTAFIEAEGDSDEEEDAVRAIESLVRPLLSSQFYWEVAGSAALEADQKLDSKQWTYGVRAMFELKAWNDSSALAKFNLLDYPFAATRALTGYESGCAGGSGCFKPRGTAWPSVLVGLDRVSAADDAPRALVGETGDYSRLRLEASFRTPVARYGADELYVSVSYRYYEELDASAAVRAADLDSFRYFTVALGGDDGIYVSYTDGRLPFDFVDDQVFELGYQFHR